MKEKQTPRNQRRSEGVTESKRTAAKWMKVVERLIEQDKNKPCNP